MLTKYRAEAILDACMETDEPSMDDAEKALLLDNIHWRYKLNSAYIDSANQHDQIDVAEYSKIDVTL